MRIRFIFILILYFFPINKLFSQQSIFKCNADTLIENLVIPCFDKKDKPGREILIFKYSGNLDSLIKYISLAHKCPNPLFDQNYKICIWQPLSEPFWFFMDYSVELKWQELENYKFVELSFAYADKSILKNKSTSIFPYNAQIFYQGIIYKALIN